MSYKLPEENEEEKDRNVWNKKGTFFSFSWVKQGEMAYLYFFCLLLYKDGDHWNEKKKLGGNYVDSMLVIQYNVQRSSNALKITSNMDLRKKCKVWCRIQHKLFYENVW